jgi:hypothetical protein
VGSTGWRLERMAENIAVLLQIGGYFLIFFAIVRLLGIPLDKI